MARKIRAKTIRSEKAPKLPKLTTPKVPRGVKTTATASKKKSKSNPLSYGNPLR